MRTFRRKQHSKVYESISSTEIGCMHGITLFCQERKIGSYLPHLSGEENHKTAVTYQADHVVQSLRGGHQVQVILHVHLIPSHQVYLANLEIQYKITLPMLTSE